MFVKPKASKLQQHNTTFPEEEEEPADVSLRHIDGFKYGVFTGFELLYANKMWAILKSR